MLSFETNRKRLYAYAERYDQIISEVGSLYSILNKVTDHVTHQEDLPLVQKRLTEEGWEAQAAQLYQSLQRWKAASLTPVSIGIMGRMSVGKTTVLMEVLSPPEDSPIRKMPTRQQETTACAVRWVEPTNIHERFEIEPSQILLSLMNKDEHKDELFTVEIEGSEEDLLGQEVLQPHLGLEVTAHPPEQRGLVLKKTRSGMKVVQSKKPTLPNELTLEELAQKTRMAVISSESALLNAPEQSSLSLLNFFDLVDFPGADAVNARAEVRDKAQRVFESNTHECDMMLFVISTGLNGPNLGAQIKNIVWVHWALRCILAGEPAYQRLLAEAVSSSYAKEDELLVLADFLECSSEDVDINTLSNKLMSVMEDADEFWAWMEQQRNIKTSHSYDLFNHHLNLALKSDQELAKLAIHHGRLGFLFNKGAELLCGDHGFSKGPDGSFWATFIETTLSATPGALEALKEGVWPKFFLIDLEKSLHRLNLVYSGDLNIAYKLLSAAYHPKEPYPLNPEQEAGYKVWYNLVHGEHIDDAKLKACLDAQRRDVYAEEAIQELQSAPILALIHDLAQSWWWSATFRELSEELQRELYMWTLQTCLHLVCDHEAPEKTQEKALGGAALIRQELISSASQQAFELKIQEAEDRYRQALVRAKVLYSKIFKEHVGSAEINKISRWAEACAKWSYWRNGFGAVVTKDLDVCLKENKSLPINEFKSNMIHMAVESALQQIFMGQNLAEASHLDEESFGQFKAWILQVLSVDPALHIYADSQLSGGRQRKEEHGRAFLRAVFMRFNVLLNWLVKSKDSEDVLNRALGVIASKKEFILLRKAVKRSTETFGAQFTLIGHTQGS